MTPQELMDLPYYGDAEKALKEWGMWKICIDDTDRMDWLEENCVEVQDADQSKVYIPKTVGAYMSTGIRGSIDDATALQEFRPNLM